MSEYTRLATGRIIYTALAELFADLEARGCRLSIDADGDVQIANRDQVPIEMEYEVQSSSTSVAHWLAARDISH